MSDSLQDDMFDGTMGKICDTWPWRDTDSGKFTPTLAREIICRWQNGPKVWISNCVTLFKIHILRKTIFFFTFAKPYSTSRTLLQERKEYGGNKFKLLVYKVGSDSKWLQHLPETYVAGMGIEQARMWGHGGAYLLTAVETRQLMYLLQEILTEAGKEKNIGV